MITLDEQIFQLRLVMEAVDATGSFHEAGQLDTLPNLLAAMNSLIELKAMKGEQAREAAERRDRYMHILGLAMIWDEGVPAGITCGEMRQKIERTAELLLDEAL